MWKSRRTALLVTQPGVQTVESQWLEVGVELVGEERSALYELWQVSNAEHTDTAHIAALTPCSSATITPVDIDCQPRLVTRITYSAQTHATCQVTSQIIFHQAKVISFPSFLSFPLHPLEKGALSPSLSSWLCHVINAVHSAVVFFSVAGQLSGTRFHTN